MPLSVSQRFGLGPLILLIGFVQHGCKTPGTAHSEPPSINRAKATTWKINWDAVEEHGLEEVYTDKKVTKEFIVGNGSPARNFVSIACVLTKANQSELREFLYTTMVGLETSGLKRFGKNWPAKREQIQLLLFLDGTTLSSMEKMVAPQLISERADHTLKDLAQSLHDRKYARSFEQLKSRVRIILLDSTDQLSQFYVSGGGKGVTFGVINAHGGFSQWGTHPWNRVTDNRGLAQLVYTVLKQLQ